jgi:hypothetical protein
MKRFRALLRLKLDLIRVFSFKFGMLLGFFIFLILVFTMLRSGYFNLWFFMVIV